MAKVEVKKAAVIEEFFTFTIDGIPYHVTVLHEGGLIKGVKIESCGVSKSIRPEDIMIVSELLSRGYRVG